jgi:hypothetical protein
MFQHKTYGFLLLLVGLTAVSSARAQQSQPWTSAGAAGTVDQASLPFVAYGNPLPVLAGNTDDIGAVSVQPFAPRTVRVRYNVVSVPGILGNNVELTLTARYLSASAGDHVLVTLKQYNLASGATTTLLTLDSASFPPSPDFQVQTSAPTSCEAFNGLDFVNNSYYVQLEMRKPAPAGPFFPPNVAFGPRPALGMVQLTNAGTCTTII